MGSPRAAPPKEGRVSGYRGYVPGYRFTIGTNQNKATAAGEDPSSPRGTQELNEKQDGPYSLTSRNYGTGVQSTGLDYSKDGFSPTPRRAQAVPKLQLHSNAGKDINELEKERMLTLNPPRAITQRSARLTNNESGDMTARQVGLLQQIADLMDDYSVIRDEDDIFLHLPSLSQKLGMAEERLRTTLLSFEGCRVSGCGHVSARHTSAECMVLPVHVWVKALGPV